MGVAGTGKTTVVERLEFDPTRKFRQYSTGNKRKLILVQAFMHRPRLLILDEPTSGLDPNQIVEIRSTILRVTCFCRRS